MMQMEETHSTDLVEQAKPDWKTKWMAIGGAAGAVLGIAAVYLYIRSVEAERGTAAAPRPIKPGSAMQVALAVLTAVRQFVNLGMD